MVGGSVTLDLSQVKSGDSVGVALLIEWLRWANKEQQHLSFTNIPDSLRDIIRVSGLESVIHETHD